MKYISIIWQSAEETGGFHTDTTEVTRKKLIGIGGNLMFMEGGLFPGYGKSYVNDDYVQAVASAGGVPLILPVTTDPEVVEAQVSTIDALVISGGWDVDPLLWGEEPHEKLGSTLPERDTFDQLLIAAARRRGLPILGICRGLQSLNVAMGGTLYQDMSEEEGSFVRHFQCGHTAQATHTVTVAPGSVLHRLLGPSLTVNSFHHMAANRIAPGLRVTARAADGTVEGLEGIEEPILAVQWHPEMMHRERRDMQRLFSWLLDPARG